MFLITVLKKTAYKACTLYKIVNGSCCFPENIEYSSTPYVGMAQKKNASSIQTYGNNVHQYSHYGGNHYLKTLSNHSLVSFTTNTVLTLLQSIWKLQTSMSAKLNFVLSFFEILYFLLCFFLQPG